MLYEIKNLTKIFGVGEGKVTALDNISIDIEKGKFAVILGPSGCGKSTLLNMIGCMDKVDDGCIVFDGVDLCELSKKERTKLRCEKLGFVFQNYNLLADMTALENVEFACELSGLKRESAAAALELVGLSERKSNFPKQMSGGEQQRVSIARAIAKKPEVLLCDEPTGALDVTTGIKVLALLKEINSKTGVSVLIITHNNDIAKIADIVITMKNGKIIDKTFNKKPMSVEEVKW